MDSTYAVPFRGFGTTRKLPVQGVSPEVFTDLLSSRSDRLVDCTLSARAAGTGFDVLVDDLVIGQLAPEFANAYSELAWVLEAGLSPLVTAEVRLTDDWPEFSLLLPRPGLCVPVNNPPATPWAMLPGSDCGEGLVLRDFESGLPHLPEGDQHVLVTLTAERHLTRYRVHAIIDDHVVGEFSGSQAQHLARTVVHLNHSGRTDARSSHGATVVLASTSAAALTALATARAKASTAQASFFTGAYGSSGAAGLGTAGATAASGTAATTASTASTATAIGAGSATGLSTSALAVASSVLVAVGGFAVTSANWNKAEDPDYSGGRTIAASSPRQPAAPTRAHRPGSPAPSAAPAGADGSRPAQSAAPAEPEPDHTSVLQPVLVQLGLSEPLLPDPGLALAAPLLPALAAPAAAPADFLDPQVIIPVTAGSGQGTSPTPDPAYGSTPATGTTPTSGTAPRSTRSTGTRDRSAARTTLTTGTAATTPGFTGRSRSVEPTDDSTGPTVPLGPTDPTSTSSSSGTTPTPAATTTPTTPTTAAPTTAPTTPTGEPTPDRSEWTAEATATIHVTFSAERSTEPAEPTAAETAEPTP
ncbi:hypothetical protein VVR85_08545 [Corynebacterium sp. LK2590]|uniref:hypothetical protein n=1 Tax=unclassified Corynebacterium TaxID=2624378 RepID=UPI0034CF63D0